MRLLVPNTVAEYNQQLHQMYFVNGSVIKFGHFQSYQAGDAEYRGQEFDWIFIDEATQFTEDEFRLLGGCLRGVNNIPKCKANTYKSKKGRFKNTTREN